MLAGPHQSLFIQITVGRNPVLGARYLGDIARPNTGLLSWSPAMTLNVSRTEKSSRMSGKLFCLRRLKMPSLQKFV